MKIKIPRSLYDFIFEMKSYRDGAVYGCKPEDCERSKLDTAHMLGPFGTYELIGVDDIKYTKVTGTVEKREYKDD